MLKKFELKNYKNFKDSIIIDFGNICGYKYNEECISNQLISKMIIYGKNATGKTNLGKALLDIKENLFPAMTYKRKRGIYLNVDSQSEYAEYTYTFKFGKDELLYKYRKSSEMKLLQEELILNGERCYYYNFELKEGDFKNLKILNADTINVERFLNSINKLDEDDDSDNDIYYLSFLRWLITNTAFSEYSIILKLYNFIRNMSMINTSSMILHRPQIVYDTFFKVLAEESELRKFEKFLNIMGIECKLVIKKLPDGKYELYFKHDRLIPFVDNASSGNLALANIYRRFEMSKNAGFMYLDEFDAYYHYGMSEKVISFFKKEYPNCQIILTTHNTNLMNNRLMRPDCLFILSQKGELTALCNATQRELREGHNLEKMYISGEFDSYE